MLKVLLSANQIPEGATVTKRTGEQKFTLRRELRVFSEERSEQKIKADAGTVFLISDRGDADAVASIREFIWYAEEREIIDLLTPPEE